MPKIKIGVLGVGRGSSMIQYCRDAENAEVVAVCDKWTDGLENMKSKLHDDRITFYTDFDAFVRHDMDAVVLANYATEHAPFAIKCMEAGKHVFSEVLPVQTLSQAVALCEAVERTGLVYAYGENYCYMPATREMRRLYQLGALGDFEYGEGEYLHNCERIWPQITRGEPQHWRNNMYASFYCTHSIGPLLHITGLRPIKVTGFELPYNDRMARCGAKSGHTAIEMITLENGAVIKSLHGVGCSRNSVWYTIYGSKGRLESAREDASIGDVSKLYINLDHFEGENAWRPELTTPRDNLTKKAESFGHGGSDYYTMYEFVEKLRGKKDADVIDVYEALDMFLPGLFAYRSVLCGGIPVEIPDFRNKHEREKYRNDHACTDPAVAGDQLIPSYSKGNPCVDPSVYETIKTNLK